LTRNRVLIVGLTALVLLVGAGGATYYLTLGSDGSEQTSDKRDTRYVFVNVEPLSAPVIIRNRVSHFIYLEVALEVREDADVREIRRQMPRLRDVFLRDLHRRSIVRDDGSGAIDFADLKARLVEQGNKVLGAGVVRDVLIKKAMRAAG